MCLAAYLVLVEICFPETASIQLSSALMNPCESSRVGTCLLISQMGPRVAAHEMETCGRKNPRKQPSDDSVPVRHLAVEALCFPPSMLFMRRMLRLINQCFKLIIKLFIYDYIQNICSRRLLFFLIAPLHLHPTSPALCACLLLAVLPGSVQVRNMNHRGLQAVLLGSLSVSAARMDEERQESDETDTSSQPSSILPSIRPSVRPL